MRTSQIIFVIFHSAGFVVSKRIWALSYIRFT